MARAGALGPSIPPAAIDFLAEQTWVIVTYAGFESEARIEVLTGPPGFVRAAGETEIVIAATPEILLVPDASIGILAIEPLTKRRMKAEGVVTGIGGAMARQAPGAITIRTRSVYALCPKHITPREVEIGRGSQVRAGTGLTEAQKRWIAGSDTFFIGTHSHEGGADASHRGGPPGFVRVIDAALRAIDGAPCLLDPME